MVVSNSIRPGARGTWNMPWTRGRRMSQSTSSTRSPSYAKVTARFAAVRVLPSPGAALVTTSVLSASPPSDQIRLVRRFRNASMPMENVCPPAIGEPFSGRLGLAGAQHGAEQAATRCAPPPVMRGMTASPGRCSTASRSSGRRIEVLSDSSR